MRERIENTRMTTLIWFRRDLRAHDHPALARAAALGPVLPLYIADPGLWAQPDAAGRHWDFLAETLTEFRADLAALGAPLVVRVGGAVEVLSRLVRSQKVTRMVSLADPGHTWSEARDAEVAAWARATGLPWEVMAPGPCDAPALQSTGIEPGVIPTARGLGLAPDPCPQRQRGGRGNGLILLDSFLASRGAALATADAAQSARAGSRLSPHLAHGTLSLPEVGAALKASGAPWAGAFAGRLTARSPDPAPGPQRETDPARLAAFARGETGLPFIDACLRAVRASGWLDAKARAGLASVALWHLWLDASTVGRLLARAFTDYAPRVHWPQIQRLAGASARICDPVRLGQERDPTGAFTRSWLPELAAVPDDLLQEPWRWSGAGRLLGRRYPEPLVDPATARAEARAARAPLLAARPRRAPVPALIETPRPLPSTSPQLSFDL